MNNLIFIGGIHGVGKGTFCNKVSSQTNTIHLSSSELIKWTEISSIQNKNVLNINLTQERLLLGLRKTINNNNRYILDGHFCLLNKENIPTNVPFETFEEISPKKIIVITEDISIISERLNNRDGKFYSLELIEKLQKKEKERAKEVAQKLNIKLLSYMGNFQDALSFINHK